MSAALNYDSNAWSEDNSDFLIDTLIPALELSQQDKQVMRWAYGEDQSCAQIDPSAATYEMISDGDTFVSDDFLAGTIKDPAGVCHDYINRVPNHTTPDGYKWNPVMANALFRRIQKALKRWDIRRRKDLNIITSPIKRLQGFCKRWIRWVGVTVSIPFWWR